MRFSRKKKMCENCPFRTDGKEIKLYPGRLEGIKEAVVLSQPFPCHKTTGFGETPKEKWVECRGAIDYRERMQREDPDLSARLMTKLLNEALRHGRSSEVPQWWEEEEISG